MLLRNQLVDAEEDGGYYKVTIHISEKSGEAWCSIPEIGKYIVEKDIFAWKIIRSKDKTNII